MPSKTPKNEPTEIQETDESALIASALKDLRAQSAADFFNENLPPHHPARITRQTAWNWLNGVYRPSDRVLMAWRTFYKHDDPRYVLAVRLGKGREQAAAHWVGEANMTAVSTSTKAVS